MMVLERSSKSDHRLSDLTAKVSVNGHLDTIMNHYQLSKRFNGSVPINWRDAQGKQPTSFVIGDREIIATYLTQWYKLLWCKYLDAHPELVPYESKNSDLCDRTLGVDSSQYQADVIRQYVTEGRSSVIADCSILIQILKD